MKPEIAKKELGNDAYSRILRYMQYPEEVSLLSSEEKILDRWIMCNTLLKEGKLSDEDIIAKLVRVHGVSRFTARNDIGYTMALFVEARKYAKEYLLYNHIEDIKLTIKKWLLDKSLAPYVPKLMHEYTVALSHLPAAISQKEKPKVVNNFFVVQGQNLETPMDYDEAMNEADQMIEDESKEKEYTDYEDLDNDNDNA